MLADRVGIIDHGHIVAEGTPAELKAEVGRPTVEAIPHERADEERLGAVLARFGEPVPCTNGVAARLRRARATWRRSSAPSTPRGSRSRTSSCTSRRSTTCSSRRRAGRSRAPRTTRSRSVEGLAMEPA